MAEAITVLQQQGAVIVDPADIPSITASEPQSNVLVWPICAGLDNSKGKDADCSVVFKYGMKRDFNTWLASLGATAPVRTLTELRQWNVAHQKAGAIKYGQARLDISDEMDVKGDRARYQADREKDLLLSATNGIDAVMKQHELDALLFPGSSGYVITATPLSHRHRALRRRTERADAAVFPEGFNAKPAPYGLSFTGTACSEPRLIAFAYAFEQATKRRMAPPSVP
jgi:amidase